jgi:nucleotide-binding universal stress UspA family protein
MPAPVPLPENRNEAENEKVRTEGEAIRRSFAEAVAGRVPVASMTTPRGNVNEILIAEARAADLVVMGKRGRNDPPDSEKPGPTTEVLIHDALRPVLVVPEKGRTQGGVLLAFDGSISAQRVLVPGTQMAKALGHGMTVLTVDSDERKARAMQGLVIKYCKSHGVIPVHQVTRGKPAAEIVDAACAYDSGLIVMGAFGHGAIRQLVFGSSTLTVLEKAPCPVLLMV